MTSSLIVFVASAGVIVVAGVFLTRYADAIADLTGLGRLLVGSILLAGATSLPELSVDVNAILLGQPNLAVGDLLGSCLCNLLILAVLDMSHYSRGRLLSPLAAAHALSGIMTVALASVVLIALLTRPSVSLGIARGVGLGPASLYTYFDSLDDVFTLLLLSSYQSLATATAAAVDAFANDPPADRAFAGILAHRRWALAHRNQFNLLFTDVLPGYAAPPGGPTVAAQVEVFQPLVDALAALGPTDPDLSVEQAGIVVWCAVHGAVALEVNHHLDWLDDPAATHETTVRRALASIGAPATAETLRPRFDSWAARS